MRQLIADLKARFRTRDHPYVHAVREGEVSREAFLETQVQLYFATRALAAPVLLLAARLTEQHGWETLLEGLAPVDPPEVTPGGADALRELISRLGLEARAIERHRAWPEVRAFNAALRGLCQDADPRLGLAALGMIEEVLGGVRAGLGAGIVARGWLAPEQLVFYPAERALEVARGEAFLARLDWPYGRDAVARAAIRDGLETGAYLARRLLDDLHAGGQRPVTRRDRARTADIARRVREMAAEPG